MNVLSPDLLTLLTIGLAQLIAVISPGPSFLITAQTAVARSRLDGVKVALGLGAGTVVWGTAAVFGLNAFFHAFPTLFIVMRIAGIAFLLWIALQIYRHAAEPLQLEGGVPRAILSSKAFWCRLAIRRWRCSSARSLSRWRRAIRRSG